MAQPDRRPDDSLVVLDDDENAVTLTTSDAIALFGLSDGLEAATVSACPDCRSRVLAAVALVDLLDAGSPYPCAAELVELAEEAPTLHLYVEDLAVECTHEAWLDPGYNEWAETVEEESSSPRATP